MAPVSAARHATHCAMEPGCYISYFVGNETRLTCHADKKNINTFLVETKNPWSQAIKFIVLL